MNTQNAQSNTIMDVLSSYIANSQSHKLPEEVIVKAKHHILDTLAAIISGSELKPGELAKAFARSQAGVPEAQVIGSDLVTSAINAAFANGIMGHADETDDSNPRAFTHPGCAIIPAALSMAERENTDGLSFLKGVVVGYDIGCRVTQALDIKYLRERSLSTHGISNNFGASTATASIARLKSDQVRYVLSYAAEQAAGVYYVHRDQEHIEKALVFGGFPARNGVTAAILVQSGFSGVWDAFSGKDNFFQAFSSVAIPQLLIEGLGERYEMLFTNIKKFSIGSPIQAPMDGLFLIMNKEGIKPGDIENITVRLPNPQVVDNAPMPDINLQYILAVTLLDRHLTFKQAHCYERMNDPAVIEIKKRINLIQDPDLAVSKIPRQGIIEVTLKDGTFIREHVVSVRGTAENPMTSEEVEKKCEELIAPVIGMERSRQLIDKIWNIEKIRSMRQLRSLLSA